MSLTWCSPPPTSDSPTALWAAVLGQFGDLDIIRQSAWATRRAIDLVLDERVDEAEREWSTVDGDALFEIWNRWATRSKEVPQHLVAVERLVVGPKTRSPSRSLARRVFERDGYRCRYCGIPVFTRWRGSPILRLIERFPVHTPNLRVMNGSLHGSGENGAIRNRDYATFLWSMAAPEHVVPASLGGPTDESNIITACWGCNSCKGDWTLEQMNLNDPRARSTTDSGRST